MVAAFSFIVFVGWPWFAAHAQTNREGSLPPCRKAGNMHRLLVSPEDPSSQALVLFGGKGHQFDQYVDNLSESAMTSQRVGFIGDTWMFDVSSTSWKRTGIDGNAPGGSWKFESGSIVGNQIVRFGGCNTTTAFSVNSELWAFSFDLETGIGRWRLIETDSPPPKRRGHVFGSNETHLIVVGGKTWGSIFHGGTCEEYLTDTWLFPISALEPGAPRGKWVQGAAFPGRVRWGATGSSVNLNPSKTEGNVFAIFGGRTLNPNAAWHSTAPDAYLYYDEIWNYDFANDAWSLAEPDGPLPMKRDHHAETVIGNELFIFGGRVKETRDPDACLADVWSFNPELNQWRERKPVNDPPVVRYMPSMSEVSWEGKPALAVFGGETLIGDGSSTKSTTLNDLWIFKLETSEWVQVIADHCEAKWTGVDSVPITLDRDTIQPNLSYQTCDGSNLNAVLLAPESQSLRFIALSIVFAVAAVSAVVVLQLFASYMGFKGGATPANDCETPAGYFVTLE